LQYSTHALEISPTFVRTYYEIGQAYMNKQDYDKAFAAFNKARELNPTVSGTYWYLGVLESARGHDQAALQFIEKAVSLGYVPGEQEAAKIIALYVKMGAYDSLATLIEKLVSANPKNKSYREQLIAVYLQLGRFDEAVAAIRVGLQFFSSDPDFCLKSYNVLEQLGFTPLPTCPAK
jgi:tetratricopeptide (TPR) repeat protein